MRLLSQQLIEIARLTPNNVAIETGESKTSYGELILSARTFASFLTGINVGIGDRVVICVENSVEYIEVLLGCWLIGAVACPINAQTRFREIYQALCHSAASLLVVDSSNRQILKAIQEIKVPIIMIPRAKSNIPQGVINWSTIRATQPRLEVSLNENMSAMILYTSGTTGSPKGVLLTHGNIHSNISSIINYLELASSDRVLAVLPFHYSYGNSVLLTHLAVGATIVLGPSMAYPQEVVEGIRKLGITGFSGVPSNFSILMRKTDFADNPGPLRYLTQAGGAMSKTLTESLLSVIDSKIRLFIMYGQTEATARLTYLPPDRLKEKLGSAGIAVDGVELKILDESGNNVSYGTVGQVVAKGENIMAGYWQNKGATSEVLKGGWLHTGDLGYVDNDGFLFLQGRVTDMIKTGAHRVSPEEIEEVACEIDGVDEAAAIGVFDELLGQAIHLYLIGDSTEATKQKVISHCREQLATHKVPRAFEWRRSLPRTKSGKLQRFMLTEAQKKEVR